MQTSTADSVASLFRPFTVGRLTVPNRIVMAPMTRTHSPDGVPGRDVAAYYARRAEHGAGLIITEGTVVDHPASANSPAVPRIYGATPLAGWARVVDAVRSAHGRIVLQLWHVGTDRKPGDLPNPGAHGYLIDQFFWERTNRRTDRYGSDLAGRTRFAAEIVTACRRVVAKDFPIFLRFSQWKMDDYTAQLARTPAELESFLAPLVTAGVDAFHCSTRRFWLPAFPDSPLTLAGWTRKLAGRPTIAVGSVGLDGPEFLDSIRTGAVVGNASLGEVVQLLERGEADLVAAGRALLADPSWTAKIREGRHSELVPFHVQALGSLH